MHEIRRPTIDSPQAVLLLEGMGLCEVQVPDNGDCQYHAVIESLEYGERCQCGSISLQGHSCNCVMKCQMVRDIKMMAVEDMVTGGEDDSEIATVTEGSLRGTDKSIYALSRVLGVPIRMVNMRPMPNQDVVEVVGEGSYEETVTIVMRPSHFNGTRRKQDVASAKGEKQLHEPTDEDEWTDSEEDEPDVEEEPRTPVTSTSRKGVLSSSRHNERMADEHWNQAGIRIRNAEECKVGYWIR